MMDEKTRIAFVHRGQAWYLPYVLNQAKHASPSSDIVFVGDTFALPRLAGVRTVPLESEDADRFARNYRHLRSGSVRFELFCWLRWFYLLEYLRREEVGSVLYLDSDVLLFSSMRRLAEVYPKAMSCALMVPKQEFDAFNWIAMGHTSYWTREALEDFCTFATESFEKEELLDLYRQKWSWAQRTGLKKSMGGAGVSDMTGLYLWWNQRRESVLNLAVNTDGNVFDLALTTARNYEDGEYVMTSNGTKLIDYGDKEPSFVKADGSGERVRVHGVHFQGRAKPDLRVHYRGPVRFKGKLYADTRFLAGRTKRRVRKALKRN